MPFTLAHPIATAPIWFGSKRRLDLPSLMIGSMIPDLEYFIALQPNRNIGHTLVGVFIQGLPCSILLLLIARYFLMHPFLALLPPQFAQRFPRIGNYFPVKGLQLLIVIVSVVIGAVSHIVWDAFTHKGGWFVKHSTLLQSKLGPLPIYKILQYSGGIVGLLALGLWLLIWLNQPKRLVRVELVTDQWRLVAIFWIVSFAFLLTGIAIALHYSVGEAFNALFVRAVIGWISGLFLGLLTYAGVFWMIKGLKFNSSET